MIITDHFVDGKWVGISLPSPAEKVIDIWEIVFFEYDKQIVCPKDYHIVFNTIHGEVEYVLESQSATELVYRCALVEDRRIM